MSPDDEPASIVEYAEWVAAQEAEWHEGNSPELEVYLFDPVDDDEA